VVSIDRPLNTLYFRQFLIFKNPSPLNSKKVFSKYKTSGTCRTINSVSDKVKKILDKKNLKAEPKTSLLLIRY
jgi:hypothetical protein